MLKLADYSVHMHVKEAAKLNPEEYAKFTGGLVPGDLVNFNAAAADKPRIRDMIKTKLLSDRIRQFTGAPEHHTAMYTGVDPATGEHMISHIYEQGKQKRIMAEPLKQYAENTSLSAYRPHGVTPEQMQHAAQYAQQLTNTPESHYSVRNLLAAGPYELSKRTSSPVAKGVLETAANAMAECARDGSGICSELPVQAYAKTMPREEAQKLFAGKNYRQESPFLHGLQTTPGALMDNPNVRRVGQYAPAEMSSSVLSSAAKRIKEKVLGAAPSLAARFRR